MLLFQDRPRRSFLLLVRDARLDLPKGHRKRGESDLACALREFEEETGIDAGRITLVDGFRFEVGYQPSRKVAKTVVLFAAEVEGPMAVITPDHDDYAWFPWRPPHDFSEFPTIHKALQAWQNHVERTPLRRRKAS